MRKVERWGVSLEAVVLALVCAAYVVWVLSLPMFPTQDGPMHMYFAHVMLALFGHGASVYERYYRIKHLLPPYSAYYYLLIGLSRFVPLFLADKLVICGYMVSFVYGFRYLARAIGPSAEQASLLATLLLLNWPLGMGFVNFCLAISLALWTLGVWMRTVGRPGAGRKVLFVAMCVGLVLVHPVPLLAVLGYCMIDLAVRGIRLRTRPALAITRADVVCLALALLTLGYVKLFTIPNATRQMIPYQGSALALFFNNCVTYGRGQGISFFRDFLHNASAAKRVYRLLLVLIVPIGLILGRRQAARERRIGGPGPGRMWLWLTVAMIVVLPFVPHDMNASHYFADRLLIFIWIGALLTVSGHAAFSRAIKLSVVAAIIAGTAATLWTADKPIRTIGREMVKIESSPKEHAGELGLLLDDPRMVSHSQDALAFNPYFWGPVNYFRHNDAVLYNTPWMDLTVIPLGARQGLATGLFTPSVAESAQLFREALADPRLRATALSGAGFVAKNHYGWPPAVGNDALFTGWQCREERGWYTVCEP